MLSHYQRADAASRALRLLDAEQVLDYERLRAENARLQQESAELERLRLENLVCVSLLSPAKGDSFSSMRAPVFSPHLPSPSFFATRPGH